MTLKFHCLCWLQSLVGTGAELLRRTYRQVRGPQVESRQQPWPVSVHGAEIIQSHNLTDFQQVAFKTECFQVIFSICLCCSSQSKCFPVYSHALFIDPLRAADMGWSLQSAVCVSSDGVLACSARGGFFYSSFRGSAVNGSSPAQSVREGERCACRKMGCARSSWAFYSISTELKTSFT